MPLTTLYAELADLELLRPGVDPELGERVLLIASALVGAYTGGSLPDPVPERAVLATVLLAGELLDGGMGAALTDAVVKSESLGDYSVSYATGAGVAGIRVGGAVAALLAPWAAVWQADLRDPSTWARPGEELESVVWGEVVEPVEP